MSNPRTTFKIVLGSFLLGAMGGASGVIAFDTVEMSRLNVRVNELRTRVDQIKKQVTEEMQIMQICKVTWVKESQPSPKQQK